MTIYLGGNRLLVEPVHGHLQIVRGVDELEVQPFGGLVGGTWDFRNQPVNGTNSNGPNTPGYGDPFNYQQIALDLGSRSENGVWTLLQSVAQQFKTQMDGKIPYQLLTFNSNSFATTLLSIIGLNAPSYAAQLDNQFVPDNSFLGFPAIGYNALDYAAYSPNFTLVGSASNDIIRTGYGNDSLSGNAGNDELRGSFGNDTLGGGIGDDTLYGDDDSDSLVGGDGNDSLDGGNQGDSLVGGLGADLLYGGLNADSLTGGDDGDKLYGGNGADSLLGSNGNDQLDAGAGIDLIDAGAGDDVVWFEATDVSVLGGTGRDIAVAFGTAPVTMDLTLKGFEIVIGTSPFNNSGDTFTGIGRGQMVAAGTGNDVLKVALGGTGTPAILWGGAGADTFDFQTNGTTGPLGILVVQVAGLTEANFTQFTRSMINVPAGFQWDQIDVVLLNPDASDKVLIDSVQQGTSQQSYVVYDDYMDQNGIWQSSTVAQVNYLSAGTASQQSGLVAGTYQAGFLANAPVSVFAAGATSGYVPFFKFEGNDGSSDPNAWWYGVLNPSSAVQGHVDYQYDNVPGRTYYANIGNYFAFPNGIGAAPAGQVVAGHPLGVGSLSAIGPYSNPDAIGPWFIAGGSFSGNSVIGDGTITATTPPDWIL